MKLTKSKLIALMLGLIFVISLSIAAITTQVSNVAFADAATLETINVTDETNSDKFNVLDSQNIVPATYAFTKLNDKECSVRISNKAIATTADIPTFGEINGVKYRVVEIAANGFMSSTNLIRVSLPTGLKKIGSMAFYNCSKLERINLSNVESIGNNAFYNCLKLNEIIIPASVKSMGTYVFKNNYTTVKLRAESEPEGWNSSWNDNNKTNDIVYNCEDIQPMELETVYSTNLRSTATIVSYTLADVPRTDNFYLNQNNVEDFTERVGNNIFVPSSFKGIEINAISGEAFEGVCFDQLVIEYGATPIKIGNNAFLGANNKEDAKNNSTITINREVLFIDVDENYGDNNESSNIFLEAKVKAIVLPDNITRIPENTFNSCNDLKNIYFRTPYQTTDRDSVLNIITEAENDNINRIKQDESNYRIQDQIFYIKDIEDSSVVYLPNELKYIGSNAFSYDNKINILIIENNVYEVGENIVDGWDNSQTILVHNDKKIEYGTGKWSDTWNSNFTNFHFDKNIYTIHFYPNDGYLDIDTMDVEYGKEIGELPTPVWEMHRFLGWYNIKDGNLFVDKYLPEKADLYLEAKWVQQYLVALKSEDRETTFCYVYAEYNELLPSEDIKGNKITILNETGKDFKGYYNEDATIRYYVHANGELIPNYRWYFQSDGEIFAKSDVITYNINYIWSDDDKFNNPNQSTFTYEDVVQNSFTFIPIVDNKSNPVRKVVWSLNQISDASKTNYLEVRYLNVVGTWVEAKANINYVLNGGKNSSSNKTTLNYGETIKLSNPTRVGYEFIGWYIGDTKLTSVTYDSNYITNNNIDTIIVSANWGTRISSTVVHPLYASYNNFLVTYSSMILKLPSTNFTTPCKITIPSYVNEVHIFAENMREYDLYIEIQNRSTDFNLHLENFSMSAPVSINTSTGYGTAYAAITMTTNNNSCLNLYSYGEVYIYGGSSTSLNYTYNGNYAIKCSSLSIYSDYCLCLYGGRAGKKGGTGSDAILGEIKYINNSDNVGIYSRK